jgi:hypothetical protein
MISLLGLLLVLPEIIFLNTFISTKLFMIESALAFSTLLNIPSSIQLSISPTILFPMLCSPYKGLFNESFSTFLNISSFSRS